MSSIPSTLGLGIRVIAVFEAAKAILILVVGFGLLALAHRDAEAVAVNVVRHLHIGPASSYPSIFIKASRHLNDFNLWVLAGIAFADSVLRGVQAVGLWLDQSWGKWLGVVSGTVYIPFEIYELFLRVTSFKLAAIVVNVVVVVYLAYSIRSERRDRFHDA